MSDPFFEEMDPVEKIVMYYNWLEDKKDNYDLAKHHGILIGSFINPEMAMKMSGEGSTNFKSTDDEFEESTNIIKKEKELEKIQTKRKRKKLVK